MELTLIELVRGEKERKKSLVTFTPESSQHFNSCGSTKEESLLEQLRTEIIIITIIIIIIIIIGINEYIKYM